MRLALPQRSETLQGGPLPAVPVIVVGLGLAAAVAGAAVVLAQVRFEQALVVALVVSSPAIILFATKPHWLLTLLFVGGGTALAGAFLGRERLVESWGGFNSFSLALLALLMAMTVILLTRAGQVRPILRKVGWHLIFLGFAILSLLWTSDVLEGVQQWFKLLFSLLALLTAYVVWQQRPRPVILKAMLWTGILIILTGPLVFSLGNPGIVYWSGRALYSGSWGVGPHEFGAFTSLLSIFSLVEYHFTRKKGFLLLALLFAVNTFASLVRSAIFPLFIAGGIYFLLTSRSPMRFAYPLLALLILLIAVTTFEPLRIRTFAGTGETISLNTVLSAPERLFSQEEVRFSREQAWGDVYTYLFLPQPLTGAGLGSFQRLVVYSPSAPIRYAGDVAGTYTFLLGELGLVGFGTYLLALGSYTFVLWRLYRRSSSLAARKYALVGLLWLVYYLGFSFGYDAYSFWTFSALVFSIVGIAFAAHERSDEDVMKRTR